MNINFKHIFIVVILILILVICIFLFSTVNTETNNILLNNTIINNDSNIIGNEIKLPDRIVYKSNDNKYFEFTKDSNDYNDLINVLTVCITSYTDSGKALTLNEINSLRDKSFLEFDYNTASKNFLLSFDNNTLTRLFKSSGQICSSKLQNIDYLKSTLDSLSEKKPSSDFNYKIFPLVNSITLDTLESDSELDKIQENIYQIKISDYDTYEKFKNKYNLNVPSISSNSFENNIVILTISNFRDIDVEVNIGNIRYTYSGNSNTYTSNVLLVSKIVNSNCIYNTDLTIPTYEELAEYHDEQVNNLDENTFETNFTQFYKEYSSSSSKISKSEAQKIADIGFSEVERIVGKYPESSETYALRDVHPNNLFFRKYYEYDFSDSTTVTAHCFSREDELGNGITIYVDNKLGKIIGGNAFGD